MLRAVDSVGLLNSICQEKVDNRWVHAILWIDVLVLGYYGRQLIKKQDDEEREERLRRDMRQVELLQKQAESRQERIEK